MRNRGDVLTEGGLSGRMGAAAGPSDPRRQQLDRRNVVVCSNSTGDSRGVVYYALGAFWVLLVTLWLCAMNAQRLYDMFLAPCLGPVLEPQPRNTPWCVAFARDLAKEVAAADGGPVRAPSQRLRMRAGAHDKFTCASCAGGSQVAGLLSSSTGVDCYIRFHTVSRHGPIV